jgi:hypothetical protein
MSFLIACVLNLTVISESSDQFLSLSMIRKTRFCRYESRSSFLTSRREMPSADGRRDASSTGKAAEAEDRDSVSVMRSESMDKSEVAMENSVSATLVVLRVNYSREKYV